MRPLPANSALSAPSVVQGVYRRTEVCRRLAEVNLPDELSGRVPDLYTVTAARVDIAFRVAVDTIGEAGGDVREDLSVGEGPIVVDGVSVAGLSGRFIDS